MAMQEKQLTNDYRESQHTHSPHELHLIAEIKTLLQAVGAPSPEIMEHLLLDLPQNYQPQIIQLVAEQFVAAMKLHILQIIKQFHQQEEVDWISASDRHEMLQEVEPGVDAILTLGRRLTIGSLGELFRLGQITLAAKGLTEVNNPEAVPNALYSLPRIYQGRLKQARLIEDELPG